MKTKKPRHIDFFQERSKIKGSANQLIKLTVEIDETKRFQWINT